ncbi:dTMP kinase [Sinosporangium siamense]|uniref:Thymidylate kinase n=1 Tax=Sinosporangium siamense TaxID=1367973 RepID=A0A919RBJ0_9ACTN|nr:dTMP kinase [Sinosporangium siamense]GII90638.1 hypothetical protein Ssi02_08690 [Sinosporangium siamense]
MTGTAGGCFIAVEGPNGVGKSTTALALTTRLESRGIPVLLTGEPSDSPLGKLTRSAESGLAGRPLALAIAADRAAHIAGTIEPALSAGHYVVSDRYLPSSLVLQRLDGLATAEIWQYNSFAVAPDITFYLEHDPAIIQNRLNQRRHRSRLERIGSPKRELTLYAEAHRFLAALGWRQEHIDCRGLTTDVIVTAMLGHLDQPII